MSPTNVFAVILAGGSGTRFWPKSRQASPKQLCQIGDHNLSMLRLTLDRLDGFIPPERRVIVTHCDQLEATKKDVGAHCPKILAEPEARNTAAALAMGAIEVNLMNASTKPTIMVSLHADAVIGNTKAFIESLEAAISVAENGHLTLLGIKPTYPETGYGYIEIGEKLGGPGFRVKSFKEKPELKLAEVYLKDERLFWNSGIFAWQTAVLMEEMNRYVPQIPEVLNQCVQNQSSFNHIAPSLLKAAYAKLPKVAIDNAILEVSSNVAMVGTTFMWQDVGSWAALSQTFATDPQGNLSYGDAMLLDTHNTTVDSDGPLVVTLGIDNMVVVAAKGAVLVCPKDRSQDVKLVVDQLKARGRTEFL